MKKEYQEPVIEVIKMTNQSYLMAATATTGGAEEPFNAPFRDDFESMLPTIIIGQE